MTGGKDETMDTNELLEILILNYQYEKANDKVWMREHTYSSGIALGKLMGATMALNLDIDFTAESITITKKGKVILCHSFAD